MENLEKSLISAINSMEQMDVVWPLTNANTNTFVKNASNMDIEGWNAKSRRQCEEDLDIPDTTCFEMTLNHRVHVLNGKRLLNHWFLFLLMN